MKLLLVDDEKDILDSVKRGLEMRGFEVDAFDDPVKALRSFKKGAYEIALLDVRMPGMNGFQLYRQLLKVDPSLKVRFITAYEEYREEFRRAFPELDERRFIKKPTTIVRLAEIITGDLKVVADESPVRH